MSDYPDKELVALILKVLRRVGRPTAPDELVTLLEKEGLSESDAGRAVWALIDGHQISVNDEAELETAASPGKRK